MHILWTNCRFLHPVNGGDRIRTYCMLRELKKNHRITYLAPRAPSDTDDAVTSASDYCHEFIPVDHPGKTPRSLKFYAEVAANSFFGKYPFIGIKYLSPQIAGHIARLDASGKIDLIVCDYLASMVNFMELGKPPVTPLVIFQHNVESLIWKRHRDSTSNPAKRLIYERQFQKTFAFEDACARFADGQITVSEEEFAYFKKERRMDGTLGAVPTGVDFDFFAPQLEKREPHTLAFLGSMDWHANIDAIDFFVGEIYPTIKERVPNVKLIVIGRNPDARIRALGKHDPSITITGTVDDVRPYLAKASAMLLPLRVGGGTRIKVFEAMAMKIPVISTTVGSEGLGMIKGEHLVLADDPASFAANTAVILENPARGEELATSAFDFIRARSSWENVTKVFEELCGHVVHREVRSRE